MAKGNQDDPIFYSLSSDVPGASFDYKQVSGAVDSVNIIGTVPVSSVSTLDVKQVSGSVWSMYVTGVASSTYSEIMNPDGRVKVELPNGASSLTDTELRASAVPVSVNAPTSTFRGRANTFRTPGRAGTVGQKIFALHNATGSTKIVHINQITVDLVTTVVKAITVAPPIIRLHRFTAIPTNGTALTKVAKDTTLSSNASITAWGDASADGTGSGTTLTVTIPTGSLISQEFAPRFITAAGYEPLDRASFLDGGADIVLRALEGIVVFLDYVLATQNPTTDMWIVGCDWYEV